MSRPGREKKRAQQDHGAGAVIDVRVPGAGPGTEGAVAASIGGVPVVAVPGEELQRTVLNHLHRIALASGRPVLATVHDERIGYVVPLRVHPDGSSCFTADPVPTSAAGDALAVPTGPAREAPAPPRPAPPHSPPAPAPAASHPPQASVPDAPAPQASHPPQAPAPQASRPPQAPAQQASAPDTPAPQASRPPQAPAPHAPAPQPSAPSEHRPPQEPVPVRHRPPQAPVWPAAEPPQDDVTQTLRTPPVSGSGSAPTFRLRAIQEPQPLGEFGPPPVMDARPHPEPLVAPDLVAGREPDPDPKPTPPRGFDAVAEAILGQEDETPLPTSALLAESTARIGEAVKAGRIDTAATAAEQALVDASAVLPPDHPELLRLLELTAYVAYLAAEPVRAFRLSLDVARSHRRTRDAEGAYGNVQSAATAWRAVRDPALGLELGRELIALWTELAAEAGPAAEDLEELESAHARMDRLATRAARASGG